MLQQRIDINKIHYTEFETVGKTFFLDRNKRNYLKNLATSKSKWCEE